MSFHVYKELPLYQGRQEFEFIYLFNYYNEFAEYDKTIHYYFVLGDQKCQEDAG